VHKLVNEKLKEGIIEIAKRIEEDSNYSSGRHFNAGGLFKLVHYVLGTGGVVLGATAGISIFFVGVISMTIGGVSVILSAIFMGVLTLVGPGELSLQHLNAGNQYLSLKKDASYFLNVSIESITEEESKKGLRALQDRMKVLDDYNGQLWTPRMAFYKARKDIRKGFNEYDFHERSGGG
jgi:hypothetical protein